MEQLDNQVHVRRFEIGEATEPLNLTLHEQLVSARLEALPGSLEVRHVDSDVVDSGAAILELLGIDGETRDRLNQLNRGEADQGYGEAELEVRAAAAEGAVGLVYFEDLEGDAQRGDVAVHGLVEIGDDDAELVEVAGGQCWHWAIIARGANSGTDSEFPERHRKFMSVPSLQGPQFAESPVCGIRVTLLGSRC